MREQEDASAAATLIMASTHIGNIDDTPSRTLESLASCDLVVGEEDAPLRALLKRAGLQRPYLKYNEHHQNDTLQQVRAALARGETVLYVSDQGCPGLADPGRHVASLALEAKATVRVVPGPSALTGAIAACPFDLNRFFYAGFLPRKEPALKATLEEMRARKECCILLDTPYRLPSLLKSCASVFPQGRRAFLALSVGNQEERYLCEPIGSLSKHPPGKYNFVLILEGSRYPGRS